MSDDDSLPTFEDLQRSYIRLNRFGMLILLKYLERYGATAKFDYEVWHKEAGDFLWSLWPRLRESNFPHMPAHFWEIAAQLEGRIQGYPSDWRGAYPFIKRLKSEISKVHGACHRYGQTLPEFGRGSEIHEALHEGLTLLDIGQFHPVLAKAARLALQMASPPTDEYAIDRIKTECLGGSECVSRGIFYEQLEAMQWHDEHC